MNKPRMTLDQEAKVNLLKNNGWTLEIVGKYGVYLVKGDRLAIINKDGLITYEDEDGH